MNKELALLVDAGFGTRRNIPVDDELGNGIWHFDSDSCEISIFCKGFIYLNKVSTEKFKIPFATIQNVKSFLTAIVLSNAAKNNTNIDLVPIQITTLDTCLPLDIPIVIYSGFLITIQESRKK